MADRERTGMDECGALNEARSGWKQNVLVLIALQVVLGLPYLGSMPRIYVDEVWDSALGYSLARTGTLRHPFVNGFGGMDVHFVQPRVVMPLVCAAVFELADYSIFASRLCSVVFGALAVVGLYAVMRRWFGDKQAFWIGLASVVHPWFFEISRRARPEVYYTALPLAFLWLLVRFADSGSRRGVFFAGMLAGLSALTHPNGIILVFSISCAVIVWRRGRSIGRLVLYAGLGTVLVVLPYVIYVLWAIRDPQVSFTEQMQIGMLQRRSLLAGEIVRWKGFLQWPKGAPLAAIMVISWAAAWFRSSAADKTIAAIPAVFALILPFASVNPSGRYLAATTPFFGALMIRLVWRTMAGKLGAWQKSYKLRLVAGISAAAVYLSTSVAAVGLIFIFQRGADFRQVVDRVASVVGPESRVYGDPIFWIGHERYRYGPYLITEGMPLTEAIAMVRRHDFDYAVKTSWIIAPPKGITRPPRAMPEFRVQLLCDHLCRLFGTKVDEFYDPYYGPIEIYKLDWDRLRGKFSGAELHRLTVCQNDGTYRCYRPGG